MTITANYKVDDHLQAFALHGNRRCLKFSSALMLASAGLLYGVAASRGVTPPVWIVVVCSMLVFWVTLTLFSAFILLPQKLRKSFAQDNPAKKTTRIEMTPERITFSSEDGSFSMPWTDVRKQKVGKDIILLYTSDLRFFMFPRRFFTEEEFTEFQAFLENYLELPMR